MERGSTAWRPGSDEASASDPAAPGADAIVQTVLGELSPAELGVTMPHEHFFVATGTANLEQPEDPDSLRLVEQPVGLEIRGWLEQHWHRNRDNLTLDDEAVAVAEARRYRAAGGRSIIDVTPVGVGRNPLGLAAVARSAGVNVVMGCGYYVDSTHPPEVRELSEEQVSEQIVGEFTAGIGRTGIRPGVIGEIGCSWPLTKAERKVLRGAAAAQRTLGASLFVHPGKHPEAPGEILALLGACGADLERVVICHVERTVSRSGLLGLAGHGCLVELDLFGMETTGSYYQQLGITLPSDGERLDWLRDLLDAGRGDQILISQDICFKHRLARYGGHGYGHIAATIVPWMRLRGFSAAEVETIVVDNPRRVASLPGTVASPGGGRGNSPVGSESTAP